MCTCEAKQASVVGMINNSSITVKEANSPRPSRCQTSVNNAIVVATASSCLLKAGPM